jgi:hypothetical protein
MLLIHLKIVSKVFGRLRATLSTAFPVPGPGDPLSTPKRLLFLLPVLLLIAIQTKADSAQVYVNGSYAFGDHGYGIGPYGGTLNGQAASFYCVDFSHDIQGQTGWSATITPLGSTGATLLQDPVKYEEMAWLIAQIMNPQAMAKQTGQSNLQTVEAELQWTIWAMSGLGSTTNPYPSWTGYFYQQSTGNYETVTGSWEILTPLSGTGYTADGSRINGTYGQEFMVMATPEPSSVLLLLAGLAALALIALKK